MSAGMSRTVQSQPVFTPVEKALKLMQRWYFKWTCSVHTLGKVLTKLIDINGIKRVNWF